MSSKQDKIDRIREWWNPVGHLNEDEKYYLIEQLENVHPRYCLETGTSTGRSSATILCYGEPKKHISIDLNLDEVIGGSSRTHIENMSKEFDNFKFVEGNSKKVLNEEFLQREYPEGIDFYFVDGGHSYEVCYSDMHNVWRQINPGGVMIVDDYRSSAPNGCSIPEVTEAVDTFSKEAGVPIERWFNKGKGCALFRK